MSLKQNLQFYQLAKPYKIDDIQGPVDRCSSFFCRAFTLLALQRSAAFRGSEYDSENYLRCLFSTRLYISGHNLHVYFYGYL